MPSTYSTNLKIELQATGENSGSWGTITNTNLGTALEQAIVGYGNPDFATDANLTLTYTNTNAAQAARALVLNVTSTGSLTATRDLVVPTIQKQYIVQNNTTGSQSITVKTSAGTGITVPNGRKAHLYVDGTNVIQMFDFVDINGGTIDGATVGASSASTGAFTTLSASSTTTLSGLTASTALALDASKNVTSVTNTGTGNNVLATSPTLVTPALGTPSSGTLTSCTGLPISTGVSGLGTGVATFLATPSSANLASVVTDETGSGALVFAASPTLTGTVSAAAATLSGNLTLNGGTANGVLYLNGSKVATSGSALTFDGTNFATTGEISGTAGTFTGNVFVGSGGKSSSGSAAFIRANNGYSTVSTPDYTFWFEDSTGIFHPAANNLGFTISGSEQMRLNSTGLGIGTSSPGERLHVYANAADVALQVQNNTHGSFLRSDATGTQIGTNSPTKPIYFYVGAGTRATLDSSGNLGLGVTPSAWGSVVPTAIQIGRGASIAGQSNAAATHVSANAYYDGAWRYIEGNSQSTARFEINTSGTGGFAWYTAPSGTAGNTISFGDAKMTLDASGNLLVGTTSASIGASGRGVIEVNGTSDSVFASKVNGTLAAISGLASSTEVIFGAVTNVPVLFRTNNTEHARITSGGSLLVGDTTGGTAKMLVRQSGDNITAWITNGSLGATYPVLFVENFQAASSTKYFITGDNSGGTSFRVATNGDVTNTNNSYGAISDVKTKQDIVDAASQWDDIKGLRVRKFRYKNDPTAPLQIGLVAQEAETVSPGLIDEHPDYEEVEVTDEEGNVKTERQLTGTSTKSVKYSVLYMKAIKTLQEAMTRIEQLEDKVSALEGTQP